MNNKAKKYFYATAGLALSAQATIASASGIGSNIRTTATGDSISNGTSGDLIGTVESLVSYATGLLYFIAVVYGLYGGFQILTAGGDDGKVKSGKTTLINAALGLAAIFLASIVINWVISLFSTTGGDTIIK